MQSISSGRSPNIRKIQQETINIQIENSSKPFLNPIVRKVLPRVCYSLDNIYHDEILQPLMSIDGAVLALTITTRRMGSTTDGSDFFGATIVDGAILDASGNMWNRFRAEMSFNRLSILSAVYKIIFSDARKKKVTCSFVCTFKEGGVVDEYKYLKDNYLVNGRIIEGVVNTENIYNPTILVNTRTIREENVKASSSIPNGRINALIVSNTSPSELEKKELEWPDEIYLLADEYRLLITYKDVYLQDPYGNWISMTEYRHSGLDTFAQAFSIDFPILLSKIGDIDAVIQVDANIYKDHGVYTITYRDGSVENISINY